MLATIGCSAAATEQQLKSLHTDVVRLKADNAVLSQRLQALEALPGADGASSAKSPAAFPGEPSEAPPELAVVTLRPGGASAGDAGRAPDLPETILEPGPDMKDLDKTAPSERASDDATN